MHAPQAMSSVRAEDHVTDAMVRLGPRPLRESHTEPRVGSGHKENLQAEFSHRATDTELIIWN